jgi:hypothetical protein
MRESSAAPRKWVVYMLGGKRAVAAPDREAVIAKAIKFFGIADPERQKRVAVSPIESKN